MVIAWNDPAVAWNDPAVTWNGDVAALSVTAISPNQVQRGRTKNVIVIGTGFVPTSAVSFSGAGITILTTEFLSSTAIRVRIEVDIAAALGARDVTVTNPGPTADTLVGGLTIIEFVPGGGAAGRSHTGHTRDWKWGRLRPVV
jgi:hypothetical protein